MSDHVQILQKIMHIHHFFITMNVIKTIAFTIFIHCVVILIDQCKNLLLLIRRIKYFYLIT